MIIYFTKEQEKACETEENTAVFYAGATYDGQNRYNASSAANEYAKEVGGTTIDLNFEEQGIEWPEDREIGRQLSQMYAENACGDVKVFLGDNDAYNKSEMPTKGLDPNGVRHPLNTWDTVECPALLSNDKISSITVYDPKTQEEIIACDRSQGNGETEDMVRQYNKYLESKGSELRYGLSKSGNVRQCSKVALDKDGSHIAPEYDTTAIRIRDIINSYEPPENSIDLTLENEND